MVKNRDLIIAVLFTFCLAAMLFSVKPTQSQTSLNYSPFYDLNHDGVINMKDIQPVAQAFGSSGDPTMPVNVTNFPLDSNGDLVVNATTNSINDYSLQTFTLNISSSGGSFPFGGISGADNPTVFCGGYSTLSILFGTHSNASIGASNNFTICISAIQWCDQPGWWPCSTIDNLGSSVFNATIYDGSGVGPPLSTSFVTETKAPYCHLVLGYTIGSTFPANWYVTFEIAVYLRND